MPPPRVQGASSVLCQYPGEEYRAREGFERRCSRDPRTRPEGRGWSALAGCVRGILVFKGQSLSARHKPLMHASCQLFRTLSEI